MIFPRFSGVNPDLGTFLVGGKLVGSWALVTTIPVSLKPILEISDLRVHRIHGTLEMGSQRILGSLVAPTTGAGGLSSSS